MMKHLFTFLSLILLSEHAFCDSPVVKQTMWVLPDHKIDIKYTGQYINIRILDSEGGILKGNYSYTFIKRGNPDVIRPTKVAGYNFYIQPSKAGDKYNFEVTINELNTQNKVINTYSEEITYVIPHIADLENIIDSLSYVNHLRSHTFEIGHNNVCSGNSAMVTGHNNVSDSSKIDYVVQLGGKEANDTTPDNDGVSMPKSFSLKSTKKKTNIYTFSDWCAGEEVNMLLKLFISTEQHFSTDKSWFQAIEAPTETDTIPLMRLYYNCEKNSSDWLLIDGKSAVKKAAASDFRFAKYKIILEGANNMLYKAIEIKPETIETLYETLEKPIKYKNIEITIQTDENSSFASILNNYIETHYQEIKEKDYSFEDICLQLKALELLDIAIERQR